MKINIIVGSSVITHMKDLFFKFYANLPLNLRKEIVLDLGTEKGGPITWEVAYREINGNTELGNEILSKLIELKFIPTSSDK